MSPFHDKVGSAIVAQRKLNARTIAPRFLTQGDTRYQVALVDPLPAAFETVNENSSGQTVLVE